MFPDIDAEDRRSTVNERVFAVRGLGDLKLAVLDREPGPARTELAGAGSDEVGAELVVAAEIGLDGRVELGRQAGAAAALLHPLPEVDVVVVLAGFVEQRLVGAIGLLDDFLERQVGKAGFFSKLVAVGHVSEVMLVVVVFERLARHVGRQRIVIVGKVRQFESHVGISSWHGISSGKSVSGNIGTGPHGGNRCNANFSSTHGLYFQHHFESMTLSSTLTPRFACSLATLAIMH
ncbi:hypothetical protein D9M72_489150 [compost metagenome]